MSLQSECSRAEPGGQGRAPCCAQDQRDGLVRAYEIADGRLDTRDVGWLMQGFRAYLANQGALPLERCLHLPTGDRAMKRARRDRWLRVAWEQVAGDISPWRRSEKLAQLVATFRCTKWTRWSQLSSAPESASALDLALFEAFRSHERVPATAMQIHNIALQWPVGAVAPSDPSPTDDLDALHRRVQMT